ncbi:methionyl-tRNA formyltransferase [Corallincola holothuriorum]|uniref:Methionyl-tRNA formyltransferase n=1 Tax=Corallincola holothuriorum TaxID=2282215 RepID=A0A368N781_9GAMM|nr:methionyl-tRNA formyltransferase [Corallincola holothuriorum]RCU45385.1 methionyl-tRNA formyltransferase [Corallincola holothuriorum]
MSRPLNIVFAGTPDFAARHLARLISSEHRVVAAYTQPDRPAGRGKKLQASAVKQLAESHQIPLFQPSNFKQAEDVEQLKALNADIMVVVAYGLLLPSSVLDTPKLGCINVHGSLLPKWRGAAPIQRAIWAGDQQTGITIMQMDIGLDTGDMLHKVVCDITPKTTSASLYETLAELGPDALLQTLERIADGDITPEAQDDASASYAKKLNKAEAKIDWRLPASVIDQRRRAFTPWPGSQFHVADAIVKVHDMEVIDNATNAVAGTILSADGEGIIVATGQGQIKLTQLQLPGKKALPAADILNARKAWFEPGTILSSDDNS